MQITNFKFIDLSNIFYQKIFFKKNEREKERKKCQNNMEYLIIMIYIYIYKIKELCIKII